MKKKATTKQKALVTKSRPRRRSARSQVVDVSSSGQPHPAAKALCFVEAGTIYGA